MIFLKRFYILLIVSVSLFSTRLLKFLFFFYEPNLTPNTLSFDILSIHNVLLIFPKIHVSGRNLSNFSMNVFLVSMLECLLVDRSYFFVNVCSGKVILVLISIMDLLFIRDCAS